MKRKGLLKFSKLLLGSFFLLAGLSTCKKYPEGGFEYQGPKMLLRHNGAWLLTLFEVNGIDSTESINYKGDGKFKEVLFFYQDKRQTDLFGENHDGFTYFVNFSNHNTQLTFSNVISAYNGLTKFCFINNPHASGCYRLFFNPEGTATTWSVQKLTKKELILTNTQKNSYKLKFIPR